MKKCSKCKVDKSINDFPKHEAGKGGLLSYCKICHNKQNRERKSRIKNDTIIAF